jgi:hypothetical protein
MIESRQETKETQRRTTNVNEKNTLPIYRSINRSLVTASTLCFHRRKATSYHTGHGTVEATARLYSTSGIGEAILSAIFVPANVFVY